MLRNEFFENVGCREIEENVKVWEHLELLYMSSDSIDKETIYNYGKKLCNFGLTTEEITHNNELKAEIENFKERINDLKIENLNHKIELVKATDRNTKNSIKERISYNNDLIAHFRNNIELNKMDLIKI